MTIFAKRTNGVWFAVWKDGDSTDNFYKIKHHPQDTLLLDDDLLIPTFWSENREVITPYLTKWKEHYLNPKKAEIEQLEKSLEFNCINKPNEEILK